MKTCKDLSKEILEKISYREMKKQEFHKRVKRVWAGALILCFLVPTAVYFTTTEELNHSQPLTFDFEQKTPFDPDVTPGDSTETYKGDERFEITLQV